MLTQSFPSLLYWDGSVVLLALLFLVEVAGAIAPIEQLDYGAKHCNGAALDACLSLMYDLKRIHPK